MITKENKTNQHGWHYVHINEAGKIELFSGIFSEIHEAVNWFSEWGDFWKKERGIELTLHTYEPGFSKNGYYLKK